MPKKLKVTLKVLDNVACKISKYKKLHWRESEESLWRRMLNSGRGNLFHCLTLLSI